MATTFLAKNSTENDLLDNRDLAIELLINRMEDGFSKIYLQLEALDERVQEIQGISDKVDMLEASVRLLENHAWMWPCVEENSSSSSVHSVNTPTLVQRSLKRNNTIGNIKYDSSAYKVSFKMDLEDSEDQNMAETSADSIQNNDFLVPNIVRSKSFSNDYKKIENPELRGRPPHQLQLPTTRSHSLKQSKPSKTARFSWNMQDVPDLKDSKFRGSMSSLASMDLGSGSVTPTPPSGSTTNCDISAKDLATRPTVLHFGNLELKKTSGFKSYKRYWAVLDSHFLYIYGREKDTKAKQVYDVSGCIVTESNDLTSLESKEKSSNASFRESLKKRGGRTFELVFNTGENRGFAAHSKEESEIWMKKLREASISRVFDEQISELSDHQHVQAVEQHYEDEVLHEVLETSSGLNDLQEWRMSLKKGHSRQHSRYILLALKHFLSG